MNLNFSGLSAAYPGYLQGMRDEGTARLSQTTADDADITLQGRQALGRALFQAAMPGAQPMPGTPQGGPMPPPPGQASMPAMPSAPAAAPPGADTGGGGMPGQGSVPQPPVAAPPAPVGGAQPGMPQLDLQTVISRIQQANPGIQPAVMMAALERAAPILSQQARQELMAMRLEFQQTSLAQRGEIADRNSQLREAADRARNDRFTVAEARRREQFEANQTRLRDNAAIRSDIQLQRLQQQREDMERRIRQGDARIDLGQAVAIANAEHRRTMELIAIPTAGGIGVPRAQREALERAANEVRDATIERIQTLRSGSGQATQPPAGGTTPAPAQAPPAVAPAAPVTTAPAAATNTPPANLLSEGVHTTFGNGQVWTLQGGVPTQVR